MHGQKARFLGISAVETDGNVICFTGFIMNQSTEHMEVLNL